MERRGYQLLQKMGYQSGQGLGRGTGGRADPLELSLKPGRTGLGIDEGRKRQRLAAQQAQQHRGSRLAGPCNTCHHAACAAC